MTVCSYISTWHLTCREPQSQASPFSCMPLPQTGSVTVRAGSLYRHRPSAPFTLVRSVSALHELHVVDGGKLRVSSMMQAGARSSLHVHSAEEITQSTNNDIICRFLRKKGLAIYLSACTCTCTFVCLGYGWVGLLNLSLLSTFLKLVCYPHVFPCIYMFLNEEERKRQARSNKQTRQSNTAHPCTCTSTNSTAVHCSYKYHGPWRICGPARVPWY